MQVRLVESEGFGLAPACELAATGKQHRLDQVGAQRASLGAFKIQRTVGTAKDERDGAIGGGQLNSGSDRGARARAVEWPLSSTHLDQRRFGAERWCGQCRMVALGPGRSG